MNPSSPVIAEREAPTGGTLAFTLSAHLRDDILAGRMAPGSKLNLDELRAGFGVSLSPLREALSRLAAEGFVTSEEQRGYRVAPVSADNLREVLRLRSELEVLAITESIRNGDNAWEARVVSSYYLLSKLDDTTRRMQNLQEWERLHRQFHETLSSACGMPMLVQFCEQLHDKFDRYRRIFLHNRPADERVPKEHTALMQAALARDEKAATEIVREHVGRVGRNLLDYVERAAAVST
jgi:GntR family carbon starvation induced transcriptional regulator